MSRVLVPLAQGCEELEAITITDLLTRAGIEVVTAGLDTEPVKASRGMTLLPDTTIDAISGDEFDMIVLPGGLPGADHLRDNATLQSMLQQQSATAHHRVNRVTQSRDRHCLPRWRQRCRPRGRSGTRRCRSLPTRRRVTTSRLSS